MTKFKFIGVTMFQLPSTINIGTSFSCLISACIVRLRNLQEDPGGVLKADRYSMGAPLPEWQREACWTQEQQILLIESIWIGLPIGFYVINRQAEDSNGNPLPLSGVLIDGQQRMHGIEAYLNDKFKVFGAYWSEVPVIKQRDFRQTHFPLYETDIWDEAQLRDLYNRLNFGGVAHREDERA